MVHGARSVVVFSPRGGAGTTTVAIAVAMRCASGPPDPRAVALLDFHLPFGNLVSTLGLAAPTSLADVGTLEGADSLAGLFTPTPFGIDVMASPVDPLVAEGVSEDECARALGFAKATHALTVVDAGTSLSEANVTAIDSADSLLMVVNDDEHHLQAATIALQTLQLLGIDTRRLALVVNRRADLNSSRLAELKGQIGHSAIYALPAAAELALAARRGRHLVRDWPDHPWSLAVGRIADTWILESSPPSTREPSTVPSVRRLRWRLKRADQPLGPPSPVIRRSPIG